MLLVGSTSCWTLGEIGVALMFGAIFADLAPTDLRGGYLGAASSPWSIGAVLGPLVGSLLLDHAGRPALGAACVVTGLLFSPPIRLSRAPCREYEPKMNDLSRSMQ